MTRCLALVLLLSGFLFGCSTVAPVATAPGASLNLQQIAAIKQWTLDGQLAFNNTTTHKGFSASIHWLNNYDRNRIDVVGPLGLWHATLSDTAQMASLQLSDGRHFEAPTLEGLMQANLDWALPVAPLHYWLFAVPEPTAKAIIKRDAYGHITDLEQAGWQLHYSEYQRISGYVVPKRIELRKAEDSLHIRFVIQRWQLTL